MDLTVLVIASAASRNRYLRAVRQARAGAQRVVVLAATDEAEQTAAAAGAGPWVTELEAVLEAAEPLLPPPDEDADELMDAKAEAA